MAAEVEGCARDAQEGGGVKRSGIIVCMLAGSFIGTVLGNACAAAAESTRQRPAILEPRVLK